MIYWQFKIICGCFRTSTDKYSINLSAIVRHNKKLIKLINFIYNDLDQIIMYSTSHQ